jgi:hypothetical protein
MRSSVASRIFAHAVSAMTSFAVEQRIALFLALLGVPVTYFRHRLTLQALRDNFWDTLLPWFFLLCLLSVWHVLKATVKVYKDEQQTSASPIVITDRHRGPLIPPLKFRLNLYGSSLALLLIPILFSYLVWSRATGAVSPPPLLEQPAFTERGDTIMHFRFSGGLFSLSKTADELRTHRVTNDNEIDGVVFPVTLYAEGDVLYADLTLASPSSKTAIQIRKNEFTVESGWDKNSSANAFEVVNEVGEVVFQLVRKSKTEMNLTGVFYGREGWVCFSEQRVQLVNSLPNCHLTPIFRYPSWKYPGQYRNGLN